MGRCALSRCELRLGQHPRCGDGARSGGPAGGFVAIGEPFWHESGVAEDDFVDLVATVDRFQSSGLALTGLIAASEDDWDRYESLHWRALEEWLAANPEHGDAGAIREQHLARRDDYLRSQRARLGWAIFVGRKS